ncbi:MAG: crossover junction endodeoxyribonuclease RuvC [Patescibacteria group bacterium]|jgi:crossover junction endodeoxyribonuclease RuvC
MPIKPKIVLGIDPGFGRVGWGVIEYAKNKLRVKGYGVLETPAKTEFALRLKYIFLEVSNLIKKYQPDLAGVERLFFSKNIKTAMQVSEARGVILLALAEQKIKVHECTPQAVKQTLVSYGRAEKLQIQRMVKTLLKLPVIPKPDDAADALAIAITAAFSEKL